MIKLGFTFGMMSFYTKDSLKKGLTTPKSVATRSANDHNKKLLLLDELSDTTCRFPIGDTYSTKFGFCGDLIEGKGPYCSHHKEIAYAKPHNRRSSFF